MSKPLKLLLLEDDIFDAELNIATLEAEGFQCTWERAQNRKEFLKALETPDYDIILLDYNLPVFDGLQALSLLNEMKLLIPVILVTGNLKAELAIDSIKAGAWDFVHKDRLTRLAPSIRRALHEVQLKREAEDRQKALEFSYALNQVANQGATLDTLAEMIAWEIPNQLSCSSATLHPITSNGDHISIYFSERDAEYYSKITKILNISMPHLEIPVISDTIYAQILRDQKERTLVGDDEILTLLQDLLQAAPFTDKVKKVLSPRLKHILPILDFQKVRIIPMVAGQEAIGVLEMTYTQKDQSDDPQRVEDILQQVTAVLARKIAEERLAQLHRDQKLILDSAGEGIFGLDLAGRHTFINPEAEKMLGYSPGELVGQKSHDLLHYKREDGSLCNEQECEIYAAYKSGGDTHMGETIFWRKDGSSFPVTFSSTAIVDNDQTVGAVVIFQDITEQVERTRENRRLAHVVEQAQVSIGITDTDGISIYVNPFFAKTADVTKQELLGKDFKSATSSAKDDGLYNEIWRTVTSGKSWQGLLVQEREDGSTYYEDANIFPIKSETGEIINYASVKREITNEIEGQRRIARQLSRFESLHLIDASILSSMDLTLTLDVVLGEAVRELQLDAIDLLVYDEGQQSFSCMSRMGFKTSALEHTNLRLGEGIAGQVALDRQPLQVDNLDMLKKNSPQFLQEGFVGYYGIPLVARGDLKGVMEIFFRKKISPDSDWQNFLDTLAGQAAIAIDNAQLFTHLRQKNEELSIAYEATLEGWVRGLELHDMETEGHSRRVVEMTIRLARRMGVQDELLEHVRRGALLHDIGKLAIPNSILNKPGPLTPEERELVEKHAAYGREMLAEIPYLQPALDIPYSHHEKWDGSGYPLGLKGAAIPLAARIFAIIDVYDALIFDRPYRKAWDREKVLDYLQEESGTHFDPDVVRAFFDEFVFENKTD